MKLQEYQGYLVVYEGRKEFHIIIKDSAPRDVRIQRIPLASHRSLDSLPSVLNKNGWDYFGEVAEWNTCIHYEEWEALEKYLITEDVRYFQNQDRGRIDTFFGVQGASTLSSKVSPEKHLQNLIQFNKLTTEGGRWLPVDENSSWYEDLPISHPQRTKNKCPETLKKLLLLPEETDNLKTIIYLSSIGLIFSTSCSTDYFRVSIKNRDNRPTLFLGLPMEIEDFNKLQKAAMPIAAIPQAFMPSEIEGRITPVIDIKPIRVKPSDQCMLPSWHPQYQNRYMQLSEIKIGEYYVVNGKVKKLVDVREGPLASNEKVFKETMIVELETLIDGKPQLEPMTLHFFRMAYKLVAKDNPPQDITKHVPALLADKNLKDRTYSKDKYIPEKPKTIIEWYSS